MPAQPLIRVRRCI